MENIFYTEQQDSGLGMMDCIVIRRKPSQIPVSIDRELLRRAGCSDMDGPNSRVAYEFSDVILFRQAIEFLQKCGWILGISHRLT